jgi:beta-1,4-mannosyltransferase
MNQHHTPKNTYPHTNIQQKNPFIDTILFSFSILMPVVVYTLISSYFVHRINPFDSYIDVILMGFKLFWFGGVILVPSALLAFLLYGSPLMRDKKNLSTLVKDGWDSNQLLNVVFVSKGLNIDSLLRSVHKSKTILESYNINYRIEIVTDLEVESHFTSQWMDFSRVHFVEVPTHFVTPKEALYKARALHFALLSRHIPDYLDEQVFNLHLDEESQVTPEVLAGISKFLHSAENRQSVGQGEIKYNAFNYGRNKLITAIDSIRTGDDLGRFRFQLQLLHKPLFGLHGSFLLIPQTIEREFGFDLGGRGSITEDAYFALIASNKGVRFAWVDGFIREQSPFTLKDILKQRKRWISGLEMLADDPILDLLTRLPLRINLILWEITWMSVLVTLINIAVGGSYYPVWLSYTAGVLTGGYFSLYTLGAYRNLMDLDISIIKKIYYYLAVFLLVPIAAVVEAVAVIYALINPMKTFEVVKK